MPYIIENFKKANLGWLFYKCYFEDSERIDLKNDEHNRGKDTLANRNETILKRNFIPCNDFFSLKTKQGFSLKVCYPGLLMGSGYTHEAVFADKDDKNEAFKIGFFFDHATGMPCIPGHSVKGALRAAFPNHKKEKYKKEKSTMIVDMLKKSNVDTEACFKIYLEQLKISGVNYSDSYFAELLGEIIFEGHEPYKFENGAFLFEQISLYHKDIFHDAFIVRGGKDGHFLANDYITHHSDPLKDPNPIKFLKILPEVEIKFQFDLKDCIITKDATKELFRQILLDFGLGAKTNVGYGQFQPVKNNAPASNPESKNKIKSENKNPVIENQTVIKNINRIKKGDVVTANVFKDNGNKTYELALEIEGYHKRATIKYHAGLTVNSQILVRISGISGKGNDKSLTVVFHKAIP